MRRCLAMVLLALVCTGAAAREYRASIEHAGARYGESVFELREQDGLRRTREQFRIEVSANGSRETLEGERRSAESSDGRPLSAWQRTVTGLERSEAEARIGDGRIVLQQRVGKQQSRRTLALPADLLLDVGLVRRIAAQPAGQAWAFDYTELDLLAAQLVPVRLSSDGLAVDGVLELQRDSIGGRRLLRWSLVQQRVLASWNLGGAVLTSQPCAEACAPAPVQDLDLLQRLAVATPYRFPAQARHGKLRYVFEDSDGGAPALPSTGEQRVVVDGRRSVVTICADCGDEAAPTPAELERYRRANAWVESEEGEIRAFARSAAGPGGSIEGRMRRLETAVYVHMSGSREVLGYASALQALHNRSGDCTEFALLLAAAARALGLPARVVGGLAYSSRFAGGRDVFSPHSWVQVWDGKRWRSFDAGLGGFESTHVVLVVGDGSPDDYAGVLQRMRRLRLVDAGQVAPRRPLGGATKVP
ncbi:transglutaminase-like domain-containing protein [Tahibacter harae]|uniref:Transglutaminase-like domain-containing protein n=1 Tax=Tahibacter harae TaxID=2963937 RepID=A0ABT1QLG7_9GAMM|nr:transglutaminase-like domain-containing protein [Tahibacter harae]MCQ4163302.1 transglutaminase-like domain-containing protein [Tahibacter harae]